MGPIYLLSAFDLSQWGYDIPNLGMFMLCLWEVEGDWEEKDGEVVEVRGVTWLIRSGN